MRRYLLEVEEEECWGCRACEVACKQEHRLPAGLRLIRVVEDGPRMTEGRPFFLYRLHLCRHCEQPSCLPTCPEGAISQRADGIVILDEKRCSGCRACLEACPYQAIVFDPEQGVARKCNLCHHRVDQGLLPACADGICLAHCIRLVSRPAPASATGL